MWEIRNDCRYGGIKTQEFISDDVNSPVSRIQLQFYAFRATIEIFCRETTIGLDMSEKLVPLCKEIELQRLYSMISIHKIKKGTYIDREADKDLLAVLAILEHHYLVPDKIINAIEIETISRLSYSPCFHQPYKVDAASVREDNVGMSLGPAPNPLYFEL